MAPPVAARISGCRPRATARCEPPHCVRDTAVASSGSARPPVSSLRSRSADDTAKPPVMTASISRDVAKYESVRLPPAWAMMSATCSLSPIRSATSSPTEP